MDEFGINEINMIPIRGSFNRLIRRHTATDEEIASRLIDSSERTPSRAGTVEQSIVVNV